MRTPGIASRSTGATPVMVPPVPTPATNASMRGNCSQQLLRGGPPMGLRIGGIAELLGHEIVGVFGEHLFRRPHRPVHALRVRGQDQRCPVGHEQAAPLDAHGVGHRQHQAIALHRRHQRQADAGVAAGRLDDRVARMQSPFPLRGLDHRQADAVLDAAARVVRLELAPHLGVLGPGQTAQANHRRVADQIEDGSGDSGT